MRIRLHPVKVLFRSPSLSSSYGVIIFGRHYPCKLSQFAPTLVRASGTDVFRLAASKLIGSKASSGTAGHRGPTCLDSGGCGRRVNRRTWATDVSSINRYLDAAATQSAPSPASLICCWSPGGTDGLLTPMFSSSLQSRRWKAGGQSSPRHWST